MSRKSSTPFIKTPLKYLSPNYKKVIQFIGDNHGIKRFQKAVKMIILLRKALWSIKSRSQLSKKKEEETNHNSLKIYSADLVFDLNYFKRPKEDGIPDEAKKILKQPIEKRTDEQINLVLSFLIQLVPEFNEFTPHIKKSIVKQAVLQEFESGRIIIRQNHIAHNYYFIISGVVSVYVTRKNPITDEDESFNIAYLRKGNSFGELAIIHGSPRNETIVCHTNVSVLNIEREEFIDIFMHVEHGREPEHISFLREIDLFLKWPISKLPYNNPKICLLTFYRRDSLMCESSEINEWIFVIKQGSCRVMKQISLSKENLIFNKRPSNLPSKYYDFHTNNLRYRSIFKNEEYEEVDLMIKNDKLPKIDNKKSLNTDEKAVLIDLKKIKANEVFGLVEIVFDFKENLNPVILVSEGCECLLINKKFFKKYMTNELKDYLKEKVVQYPNEYELQKKYQINSNWIMYKQKLKKF